jgi:CheY-like chemotaxis protein
LVRDTPSAIDRGTEGFGDGRTPEAAGRVVLIADDAAELREVLAIGLRHMGFRVEQATDGADAVAKTIALSPDIVAMDYSMPNLDGGEAARRLASDERTRGIPVLLLSSNRNAVPRDVRLGCAAFLDKPCNPEELGARLLAILAARKTR